MSGMGAWLKDFKERSSKPFDMLRASDLTNDVAPPAAYAHPSPELSRRIEGFVGAMAPRERRRGTPRLRMDLTTNGLQVSFSKALYVNRTKGVLK